MVGEWTETTLGDVAHFDSGHRNSQDAVENGEYPFFTCSREVLRHSEFDFDTEAVIMAGNNAEARFHLQYFKGKFAARQRTYIITPATQGVDCRFLYYALHGLQPLFAAQAQGTTTKFVTIGILRNAPISMPPTDEQRAIANILGTLDDKIELNRRMNETLEAMARALFKSWFVDFDPVRAKAEGKDPGLPKPLADLFPDSFEDSELGEIPKGWNVRTLGEVADVNWGDTKTTKKSYIDAGYVAYSAAGPDGFLPYFDYDRTGVVVSAIGSAGLSWLAIGKWSCIKNTIRLWATDPNVSTEYLFHATLGEEKWPLRGSVQPFISQGDARNLRVLIPGQGIAATFGEAVRQLYARAELGKQESQTLTALRDTLLPKLISGELGVTRSARVA